MDEPYGEYSTWNPKSKDLTRDLRRLKPLRITEAGLAEELQRKRLQRYEDRIVSCARSGDTKNEG